MKRPHVPTLARLLGHPPTFDWVEARRRVKAGQTMAQVARDMGVDRRSVNRVMKMSEAHVQAAMTAEQRAALLLPDGKVPCPQCGRPKRANSRLCRDCYVDVRLDEMPMDVRKVPGVPRTELRNVSMHRIVAFQDGRFGVMLGAPRKFSRSRVVDFWDGGRELVSGHEIVKVMPGMEITIGGEVQKDELIACV